MTTDPQTIDAPKTASTKDQIAADFIRAVKKIFGLDPGDTSDTAATLRDAAEVHAAWMVALLAREALQDGNRSALQVRLDSALQALDEETRRASRAEARVEAVRAVVDSHAADQATAPGYPLWREVGIALTSDHEGA